MFGLQRTSAERGIIDPALQGRKGCRKGGSRFRARQRGTHRLYSGNPAASGKNSAVNFGIRVEPLESVPYPVVSSLIFLLGFAIPSRI
jgi:hypothetical protein